MKALDKCKKLYCIKKALLRMMSLNDNNSLFYDDLKKGHTFKTNGRTIFGSDIVNFVCNCGFFEELFTNIEHLKTTHFKKRVVPGALTFSFAEGLVMQNVKFLNKAGIAFLGMDNFRIYKPVYKDDTIRVTVEIISKQLTKKNDRGIIKFGSSPN